MAISGMSPHQGKIDNVKDFLTHLWMLSGCQYNEVVSYVVWKVLNTSLKPINEVDWDSILSIFRSENWNNGAYNKVLRDASWKSGLSRSPQHINLHAGTMCNRLCTPLETVYYCFTCTMNPLYEICEYCFDEKKHEGHTYTAKIVVRKEGRVCHCGDPSIFKNFEYSGECKNELSNHKDGESSMQAENYDDPALQTFNSVLDYLIDATLYLKEQNEDALLADNVTDCKPKPEKTAASKTVLVDSKGNVPIEEGDPIWALQIDEEDCNVHYMDLTAKIARTLNKPAEHAMSITDMLEKGHPSVTVIKSSDLPKLKDISKRFQQEGILNHIRNIRDTFERDLVDDLIHWLYVICTEEASDLSRKKAIRLSMLDAWESGLMSTKFTVNFMSHYVAKLNLLGGFLVSYEQRDTFPWFKPWNFEELGDTKALTVMSNYDKRLADTNVVNTVSRYQALHGSRFQYILVESINVFSRISRYRTQKIISSLFTLTDSTRCCLAAQYFDIYLAVLYSTVAFDCAGFKVSLMSVLSQYTFQQPSAANMAIQSGFIQRTLRVAFTLMAFTSEDLLVYLPIPLFHGCKLPKETIRNRRTIICFKDICILMSTNTVPLLLLDDEDIRNTIITAFSEFNDILPLKRETSEHVEFENFDFSSYYFYFSSVLIMVDGYIRSISLLNEKKSRTRIVTKLIELSVNLELELLSQFRHSVSPPFLARSLPYRTDQKASFPMKTEKICNYVTDIINFQVGVDTQNFFNPMSYLFKFVVQWSQCGRYTPLPEYLNNYLDLATLFADKKKALLMCESALSTLVLLGQINVGFWIRNGAPITHQARMYTKYSMREFTYASDIFNVQFSMSFADPNDFMVTFLARWGLKNWANGVPMGDYPNRETTVAIINECLLLLVQLFTEIKSLVVVSSVDGFEKTLRAEIVHALCFKSCSYSQIMDSIPEHITKHAAFDLYLEEYTTFTPPSGATDYGIYSLKPEYKDEIDPYYLGLSPSRRYEAEKNIRASMASIKQIHYDETFVPVKNTAKLLKSTPYTTLYAISSTDTFGLFLKNTLDHINKFNYENLLPIVVHLIHLCVVNNLDNFMRIFWREYATFDTEFDYYNSVGSILYAFLLKENFIQVHGKIREIFRYLVETAPHVDASSYLKEQTDSFNPNILWSSNEMKATKDGQFERKKKLAKMRKEKMLKELARQQLKFMENNSLVTNDAKTSPSIESADCKKRLGWKFPEETCVFCKMSSEEDTFIFFSYQEDNICDHGVDFSKKNSIINMLRQGTQNEKYDCDELKPLSEWNAGCRLQNTYQGAILRTCGHGAHISCLGNHMKSIRAAHSQTTKNVPVSYGFGLMYCPLCNGLCNSFLPLLSTANTRITTSFFEDQEITPGESRSTLHLSTIIKAARIFEDLDKTKQEQNNNFQQPGALSKLFVNTTSNLELTMRNDRKSLLQEIPSQRLLTLRLLNELMIFLTQYGHQASVELAFPTSWEEYLPQFIDTDLLVVCHQIMRDKEARTDKSLESEQTGIELFKGLFKRRIIQDMLILAKELLKVRFYSGYIDMNDPSLQFTSSDRDLECEVRLSTDIFISAVLLLHSDYPALTHEVHLLRFRIHSLLTQSASIFLKRLSIMFHAQYAVESRLEFEMKPPAKLGDFLSYLEMPSFASILQELHDEQPLGTINTNLRNLPITGVRNFLERLDRLHFPSDAPLQLVKLPHSLSHFFISEEENLMHKVLKDDIAICLFCGKKLRIQQTVPFHGYVQGVCTNHVRNECRICAIYGVFLMVRSNAIYLSYGERGTFFPAPYVHKHGEPDEDLKYDTPVFLDKLRYEHLCNNVILDNMIPHIVLRRTDGNSDLGGWETL